MSSPETHLYATFVHGFLVFGHALGVIYNVKRRNRVDVAVHTVALVYSMRSVLHHMRKAM